MPVVAPKAQVLYRRTNDILFGWTPLSLSDAKSYNLYASATLVGVYALIKSNIQNITDNKYKKVVIYIKDSDIPIPPLVRYYFKLTYVDNANVESNIANSVVTTIFPPDVQNNYHNENDEDDSHNFAWVEENQRWEKLILTPDGKLKVDATIDVGDITLGSVKIATLPDDITKKYILVDNSRRSVVSEDPTVFSRIQKFQETPNVITNSETQIFSYTNAQSYFVNKIICSGTSDAKFTFKIDGAKTQVLRNSWNNRNITFDFIDKALLIPANSIISITSLHEEKNAQDFEVSFYGFTYTY